MSKILLALVFAAVIAFTVTAITGPSTNQATMFGNRAATNAAFRDGLYLGKLDAQQGRDPHLSVGRWSRDEDRIAFSSGYQQSYTAAGELAEN